MSDTTEAVKELTPEERAELRLSRMSGPQRRIDAEHKAGRDLAESVIAARKAAKAEAAKPAPAPEETD